MVGVLCEMILFMILVKPECGRIIYHCLEIDFVSVGTL